MFRFVIAVLLAAVLPVTLVFDHRWRRMRRELIRGAEQYLREAVAERATG